MLASSRLFCPTLAQTLLQFNDSPGNPQLIAVYLRHILHEVMVGSGVVHMACAELKPEEKSFLRKATPDFIVQVLYQRAKTSRAWLLVARAFTHNRVHMPLATA